MGSLGMGRRMMVSRSPNATCTLAPGIRPILFRRAAGITTCPLADMDTIGIDVSLSVRMLNHSQKRLARSSHGVKCLAGVCLAGMDRAVRS
jgi:hypothetical protein